jgi:flagellar basal-body rod protein FlgC
MDVISSNLANAETTKTAQGGPYRREMVVFEPRAVNGSHGVGPSGVDVAAIVQDQSAPNRVYQPNSPQADNQGFVAYPNVDLTTEMVDLMAANRAYEANASVIQTAKTVVQTTLDLGRA